MPEQRILPKRACAEAVTDKGAPKKKKKTDAIETQWKADQKRDHKERFLKALEHHIIRKDKLLVRFTRDNIFRIVSSELIRKDISYVFCAKNCYTDSFVIGDKIKCFYLDEKGQEGNYVCLFQGSFPSSEAAEKCKLAIGKAFPLKMNGVNNESAKKPRKQAATTEIDFSCDGNSMNTNVRALTESRKEGEQSSNVLPLKTPSFLEMRRLLSANPDVNQSTSQLLPHYQRYRTQRPTECYSSSGDSTFNTTIESMATPNILDDFCGPIVGATRVLNDDGYVPSDDVRALTTLRVTEKIFEKQIQNDIAAVFSGSRPERTDELFTGGTIHSGHNANSCNHSAHNEALLLDHVRALQPPSISNDERGERPQGVHYLEGQIQLRQASQAEVASSLAAGYTIPSDRNSYPPAECQSGSSHEMSRDPFRALTADIAPSVPERPLASLESTEELFNSTTVERNAVREARNNQELVTKYGEKFGYLFRYPLETKMQVRFKTPSTVPQSSVRLFDYKSPWYFQIKHVAEKQKLVESYDVFIDKDYKLLVHEYLHNDLTLTRYIWFLMLRLLGGEAGLRRVVSLFELERENARETKNKRPYNNQEKILGSQYFKALESHVQELLRNPARPGGVRRLPATYPTFLTEKMLNWSKRLQQAKDQPATEELDI